jgi:signal transduction histidine kinase
VLEFAGRAIGLTSDMPGVFVVSLASFTLCFVVIALSGINQHRKALIAEMDYLLNTGFWQIHLSEAIESRHATDAATYLHHKVQSQLLAVALQLEMAVQSNDQHQLIESIDKARSILTDSTAENHTPRNLYDSILKLPAEWEGICAITLHLPPENDLPTNTWNLIDMLLRELVANGVRSGHATAIEIEIEIGIKLYESNESTRIDVTIDDNGTGPTNPQSGLGTTWLDTIAMNVRTSKSPLGGMSISLQLPLIE